MSTWILEGEKDSELVSALLKETDRSAAIIAGTIVEDRLTKKLKENLRDDEAKDTQTSLVEMFRSTGPLGAFASKIRLGFLMRLYGTTAYKDLMTVKDIRNRFAHRMDILSFETNEIVTLCRNLKIIENYVLPVSDTGSRPFTQPKVTNGIVEKEDWIAYTLHNASIMGTVYVEDRRAHLANYRERFLSTCGILMSHFSFTGARVPIFIGDEQQTPSLEKY
jgi:hypothetical protein